MNESSYYHNESLCELILSVQHIINEGWRIVEIKYGERRLGIASRLVVERGEVRKEISPDERDSLHD